MNINSLNLSPQKVGEALGSLKSLHQQLDELIEWENHMIQKIGELNIPTGSKEEVRKHSISFNSLLY